MILPRLAAILFCCLTAVAFAAEAQRGQFEHAVAGRKVKVWYYVPAGAAADAPVVFVMHGVKRNGEDYLDDWTPAAAGRGFLLVVPEFSQAEFPGEEGYIYGNTADGAGRPLPKDAWAFSAIESVFDDVRARFGNRSATYRLYGHSAGAQFVHRFVYFMPQARLARAVSANAGWYTLPDLSTDFPYGLKGTPVTAADRATALARPMVVLLGEADTDPHHPALRRDETTDRQGLHRFARGQYYFRGAQELAAREKLAFGWTLATAPGVAHSNRDMVPFALRALFP